jgi:phenylalanyl-tRNA synthetase beta chain
LILKHAGGELVEGVIDVGPPRPPRESIVLRLSQLARILGIEIPGETVGKILAELGCQERCFSGQARDTTKLMTVPPSWRRDLSREIDLVEEVARIHGYDKIPEDARVPMAASHKSDSDRVVAKVRQALAAGGFDEAMTASVVPEHWSAAFSPWTEAEALTANTPLLEEADRLRRSLVPSLLDARRLNESLSNPVIELFETARIYLPRPGELPSEPFTLAAVSGQGFLHVKGMVETLLDVLHIDQPLGLGNFTHALLVPDQAVVLSLGGQRLGFLGDISTAGLKSFGIRGATTVLELDIGVLIQHARLTTKYAEQSPYPTISRDLNLIVAETVRWGDLSATAQVAAGPNLERLTYLDTYRDVAKDGPGVKRLLFTISLRPQDRTLTGSEADAIRDAVVAACQERHAAKLLA